MGMKERCIPFFSFDLLFKQVNLYIRRITSTQSLYLVLSPNFSMHTLRFATLYNGRDGLVMAKTGYAKTPITTGHRVLPRSGQVSVTLVISNLKAIEKAGLKNLRSALSA